MMDYEWCIGTFPLHCDIMIYKRTVLQEVTISDSEDIESGIKHYVTVKVMLLL